MPATPTARPANDQEAETAGTDRRHRRRADGRGIAGDVGAARDGGCFFYTPSDIVTDGKAHPGQRIRLGGLDVKISVKRNGQHVSFVVTDTDKTLAVSYTGILPDLFREGQGVVAEGKLDTAGVFVADTVLAKHDENYMPKEVADALKKEGCWQEGAGQ